MQNILDAFYEMIPASKKLLFDRIAPERTRHLTVILENIYQEHNASAIMRSCESLGIQEMHIIEKRNNYKVQRDIARGAGRWIDTFNYSTGEFPLDSCIDNLKDRGYKIAILTPEAEDTIFDINLDKPIALLFGTEWEGVSDRARMHADYKLKIPMYGFTESFNVSVSVALTLQAMRERLEREKQQLDWKLNSDEIIALKLKWCEEIMKNGTKVRQELERRLSTIQ